VAVSKCIADDVGIVFQQQPSSIPVVHGHFFYSSARFICAVDERISYLWDPGFETYRPILIAVLSLAILASVHVSYHLPVVTLWSPCGHPVTICRSSSSSASPCNGGFGIATWPRPFMISDNFRAFPQTLWAGIGMAAQVGPSLLPSTSVIAIRRRTAAYNLSLGQRR